MKIKSIHLKQQLAALAFLAKISFQSKLAYKKRTILELVQTMISMCAMIFLWKALEVSGYTNEQTLGSLIMFSLVSTILGCSLPADNQCRIIEGDIRTGNIAQKLLRPLPYEAMTIAQSVGLMVGSFVVNGIPILILSGIYFIFNSSSQIIIDGQHILPFILSMVAGIIIYLLLDLISGYLCFWFTQGTHIRHFFEALFISFSGRIIPLFLLPSWFQEVSKWTPARLVYNDPISIISGLTTPDQYSYIFIRGSFWLVGMFIVAIVLKRFGQKRIFIQGG